MRDEILKALENTEKEYDIQILYACESGSRAWGFASTDSDYDVRFIYRHKPDWYLSIEEKRDVIDLPINDLLDIGGWDILKTLRLIRGSNAVIWEWMQSPIVYKNSKAFLERLWDISRDYYALKSGCYHYLAQVRNGIKEHFSNESIKLKKYFYILRPLLAAKWIFEKREIPPMEFYPVNQEENKDLRPVLMSIIADKDKPVKNAIEELIEIKKEATEKDTIKRLALLDEYIEAEYYTFNAKMQELSGKNPDNEPLNIFFRSEINNNGR